MLAAGMGLGHPGTIARGSLWKSLYLEFHMKSFRSKVLPEFYLINFIMDCSSTTVSWSLAMIRARGVLSYENQLPCLKIIFDSN